MTDSSDTRPDFLARNFSAQLKGAFNLGGDLPTLSHIVEEKKHTIIAQRHELHEIEAQLEATEEALAEAAASSSASGIGQKNQSLSSVATSISGLQQPPVSGQQIQVVEPHGEMRHLAASGIESGSSEIKQSIDAQKQTAVAMPDVPGQWYE